MLQTNTHHGHAYSWSHMCPTCCSYGSCWPLVLVYLALWPLMLMSGLWLGCVCWGGQDLSVVSGGKDVEALAAEARDVIAVRGGKQGGREGLCDRDCAFIGWGYEEECNRGGGEGRDRDKGDRGGKQGGREEGKEGVHVDAYASTSLDYSTEHPTHRSPSPSLPPLIYCRPSPPHPSP